MFLYLCSVKVETKNECNLEFYNLTNKKWDNKSL